MILYSISEQPCSWHSCPLITKIDTTPSRWRYKYIWYTNETCSFWPLFWTKGVTEYHFDSATYSRLEGPIMLRGIPECCDSWSEFIDESLIFFFTLKEKFAEANAPWKQTAGWSSVKQLVAMTIINPSKVMKTASSDLNRLESKPPESSTIRYELRIKIVMVAVMSPIKNTLNRRELVISRYLAFQFPLDFRTRRKKSVQAMAKRASDTSWKIRPANIRFLPRLLELSVLAVDAMAPPKACKTRQMKSHVQKTIVYVRGRKRECVSP